MIMKAKNDSSPRLATSSTRYSTLSKSKDSNRCEKCDHAERKLEKVFYCERERVMNSSLFYCQLKETLTEPYETCEKFERKISS